MKQRLCSLVRLTLLLRFDSESHSIRRMAARVDRPCGRALEYRSGARCQPAVLPSWLRLALEPWPPMNAISASRTAHCMAVLGGSVKGDAVDHGSDEATFARTPTPQNSTQIPPSALNPGGCGCKRAG